MRISDWSSDVCSSDLGELPPFTPGSHVKVRVPNGELRKYSLCNDAAERDRYVITVKRDAQGRGGSISLVDQAAVGDTLPTSMPDNAFALVDNRSEEHTSELQSLMRTSYAVFCLKKKH